METKSERSDERVQLHARSGDGQPVRIVHVTLEGLFGLYKYEIPAGDGALGRISILYGENGLGKTTILKILFHILSGAGDRGHRTALGRVKFRRVRVELSNGIYVQASRKSEVLDGAYRLEVIRYGEGEEELLGAWDWFPEGEAAGATSRNILMHANPEMLRMISEKSSSKSRHRAIQSVMFDFFERESNPLESEEAFLRALRQNVPPLFFLTADRILSADLVDRDRITSSDFEHRGRMRPEDMLTRGRERALNDAIGAASTLLSRLGVEAARQGSTSMQSIYEDLIQRFSSRESDAQIVNLPLDELKEKLLSLSDAYDRFFLYGLAPKLRGKALVTLLARIGLSERKMVEEILQPYVESLTEQANSLEKAYYVIDILVSTVNSFLHDKRLEFSVGEGLVVRSKLGDVLEPKDLSSGEQQLLLLFCHITMAHDSGGIFIVDEPEISLNIRWQRRLVDSLLKLDSAKNLQFILASHSMEILTQHRDSVVTLKELTNE